MAFLLAAGVLRALSLDLGSDGGRASTRDQLVLAAQSANVFVALVLLAGSGAFVLADHLHTPDDEWPSPWTPAALRAVTVAGAVVVIAAAYLAVQTGFQRGTFAFQPDGLARAAGVLSVLSTVPLAGVAVWVADRALAEGDAPDPADAGIDRPDA